MSSYQSNTEQLLFRVEDKVAHITLNRPEARNALSDELTSAMREAVAWSNSDSSVGAILISGAGGAFCSGGDVKAMNKRQHIPEKKPTLETQFQTMRARHHQLAGALHASRKPSIAAITGPAAGAGLALALACDMRLMAQNTFVSTGYAKIGLSGDYGIAWLLTRIVGPGRARQFMLTSERIQAEDAFNCGLVSRLVESDNLLSEAQTLAAELANGPLVAYSYIKDNLDEALTVDHATAIDREADRLLKARTSADHKEAVAAFAEKRPPNFIGS